MHVILLHEVSQQISPEELFDIFFVMLSGLPSGTFTKHFTVCKQQLQEDDGNCQLFADTYFVLDRLIYVRGDS